jgi:hypothetical protein
MRGIVEEGTKSLLNRFSWSGLILELVVAERAATRATLLFRCELLREVVEALGAKTALIGSSKALASFVT